MISKLEFQEYVRSLISEEDKEKLRKAKTKFAIILSVVLFIEAVSFTLLAMFVKEQVLRIALLIFMVILMFISFFVVRHNHSFNWSGFKEVNMPKVLDFLLKGQKYDYSLNNCIPSDVFEKSPFAEKYDDYAGEDLLSINIPNDNNTPSNTWFHISDLSITKQEERINYKVDKYGNTQKEIEHYTVSVFKGAFAYVQFPTMFKCKIGINVEPRGCKKINFEDVNYNKKLKTYSDNELEAFIVLTPDLINKLKELEKRYDLKLVMYDNKLVMEMPHSNLFEFTKDKDKFEPSMFDNFYDDIVSILGIVMEIKNNNKLFKF